MRRHLRCTWAPHAVLAFTLSILCLARLFAHGQDVHRLTEQLESPSTTVRLAAAAKIAELGPAAAEAAPALIEALKCERIEVLFSSGEVAASRQRFADALVQIGGTIAPKLAQALEHENDLVRVWSAYALHAIDGQRYRADVVPVLAEALKEGGEVAADASQILQEIGTHASPAIPALIEQLDHRELAVRANVAHALGTIAKGNETRQLMEALQHDDPIVRVGAAFALHRADPESSANVRAVISAALQDESREARRQAVWAIGQMGVAASFLADELIAALPELDPNLGEYFFGGGSLGRQSSDPSIVLAAMGPASKPSLLQALESEQPRVRVMAAVALMRMDRSETTRVEPILKEAVNDVDRNIRLLAQMNQASSDLESKDVNDLIRAMLQSPGFGPPSPATFQLMRRGAEAVGPLMALLKGGDGVAAQRAANVLARIGAPAMPALREALESENDQLRVFAISALSEMGEPALPVLVTALDDDLYPVRRTARHALRSIGTPEALEALQKSQGVR